VDIASTRSVTCSVDSIDPALMARARHLTDAIAITYLGQVGFVWQHRSVSIAIDPYLSDAVDRLPDAPPGFWSRRYAPPIAPDQLRDIGLVLCTHDHLDHTDPETLAGIAQASPAAIFAGPGPCLDVFRAAGLDSARVRHLRAGVPFAFQGTTIEPVAVAHEDYERDAAGDYSHLGYVLHMGGCVFFHAGDTTSQDQLSADLGERRIDVAFLPINGRHPERSRQGIVGNMNAREAIEFAARHAVGLLVPTHYDLYMNNGASLSGFVAEMEATSPRQRFKAFRPGEQMLYLTRESAT
jgi:L-ascorbate 6-phosphate lactonase